MIDFTGVSETLADRQLLCNWEFMFDLGSINPLFIHKDNLLPTRLMYKTKSINLRNISLDTESLPGGNYRVKGVTFPNELDIEFYEDDSLSVYKSMKRWQDNNYDSKRKVFFPKGKPDTRNGQLNFVSGKNFLSKGYVKSFLGGLDIVPSDNTLFINSMMLTNIGDVQLDQEDTGMLILSCTFSFKEILSYK
jgi:hypothetical protein